MAGIISAANDASVAGGTDKEVSSTDGGGISDTLSEQEKQEKVVLITGGGGFIGSHVADFLLNRGDKVVIVDEMNDYYDVRLKNANLEYLYSTHADMCVVYQGDICDEKFMTMLWEKEAPTHVCHLAARAGVRPSIVDPYIYVHSNVEGKHSSTLCFVASKFRASEVIVGATWVTIT